MLGCCWHANSEREKGAEDRNMGKRDASLLTILLEKINEAAPGKEKQDSQAPMRTLHASGKSEDLRWPKTPVHVARSRWRTQSRTHALGCCLHAESE